MGFGGRQIVKPEDLSERDTKTGYHRKTKEVKGKRNIKYRDLFRKGRIGILLCLVKDKILSMEIAADRAKLSLEKFEELYQNYLKQHVA